MSYTLLLKDLRFHTRVGVYAWERVVMQPVEMTLAITPLNDLALHSGSLDDAINYVAINDAIKVFVSDRTFGLLECLASEVMDALFAQFPVRSVSLTVSKPMALTKSNSVSVCLFREATRD